MARPCRIYPLGANTELADTESGKLYKAVVTETGSGASANIGKITTITSEPGAGVFDDVFVSGDYLIIRHQEHGMLGVGQWIKVQSVSGTGAAAELTLEDGAAEFYSYLNASGAKYSGQTSVGITFEKVRGWGIREMTEDQVDDSLVVPIFERWGALTSPHQNITLEDDSGNIVIDSSDVSVTTDAGDNIILERGLQENDHWRGNLRIAPGSSATPGFTAAGTLGERFRVDESLAGKVQAQESSAGSATGNVVFSCNAHSLPVDHPIVFTDGGGAISLPGGVTAGTTYYVQAGVASGLTHGSNGVENNFTISTTRGAIESSGIDQIVTMVEWSSGTEGTPSPMHTFVTNTANFATGDHPTANTVRVTNKTLEWCSGSNPYNDYHGILNSPYVDDLTDIKEFIKLKDGTNPTIQEMTQNDMEVSDDFFISLEAESGSLLIDSTDGSADAGDKIILDTEDSVIERCIHYYTSAANTVGSYHIGTSPGDSDTGSWSTREFYKDEVLVGSGEANTTFNLYRKESGITRGWSGTRLLTNANTALRAANSVTHWSGANADYIAVGNFPRAATDEVIYKPLWHDSTDNGMKAWPYPAGIGNELTGTVNDTGLHLYWFVRLLRTDRIPNAVGEYSFIEGNDAPGTGTWQSVGGCYERYTTHGDIVYSTGYEGIYSAAYEGIYSGTYSQGFTGGYTLTYGSGGESPNPQASSEGPTYSATYSQGFTGAYAAFYSGQYVGIYSFDYTGGTIFTTVDRKDYSFWKRVG